MTDDKKYFTFVIMPFSNDFDDIYQLGIKEVAKKSDVIACLLYTSPSPRD